MPICATAGIEIEISLVGDIDGFGWFGGKWMGNHSFCQYDFVGERFCVVGEQKISKVLIFVSSCYTST